MRPMTQAVYGIPPEQVIGSSIKTEYKMQDGEPAIMRLMMLVHHDDADREYAYGPANGLPSTHFGGFPQKLMDEAKTRGWVVISMKNDWKSIFSF